MEKLFKISIIMIFAVSLSACGKKQLTPNTDGPDVLMARDCGLDKMQCCAEEPACSYSQKCCTDPNDKDRNYCSNECTCGAETEFCCAGDKCNDGLECYNGYCSKCGGKDQPCCESSKCGDGLACADERCVECGLAGNPCCGEKCQTDDKEDDTRTECQSGICASCGTSGHDACHGGTKCVRGNLFNNDTCFGCGQDNEPCCDEQAGLGYDCDPKKNLECDLGFCTPKK